MQLELSTIILSTVCLFYFGSTSNSAAQPEKSYPAFTCDLFFESWKKHRQILSNYGRNISVCENIFSNVVPEQTSFQRCMKELFAKDASHRIKVATISCNTIINNCGFVAAGKITDCIPQQSQDMKQLCSVIKAVCPK